MDEKLENDLRVFLPILLADAEKLGQDRQAITNRIIVFIKKCEEVNKK